MKYKQNLKVVANKVFSYNTHVATIKGNTIKRLGYWSKTTTKHVNHVRDYFNLAEVK
jgi:hypothetical protein